MPNFDCDGSGPYQPCLDGFCPTCNFPRKETKNMVASNHAESKALVRVETRETAIAPSEVLAPMSWQDMVKMGQDFYSTGMLPDHVKNGAQAALIILTGREMGMGPMQSLRALQVVKGKVIEDAASQLARFNDQGNFSTFEHDRCPYAGCKAKKDKDGKAIHLDDEHASLLLRTKNGRTHVETWTKEDTQKAGLGGGMHSKFTKAMFRSRAATAGLKSVGWLGSVGNYDRDEAREFLGDEVDRGVQPQVEPRTQVSVKTEAPPVAVSQSYRPNEARTTKLKALLDDLGIGNDEETREARLKARQAFMAEVNGGRFPSNDTECDCLISELEGRLKVKREQDEAAEAAIVDGPAQD